MKPTLYAAALSGLVLSPFHAAHAQSAAALPPPADSTSAPQQDEAGHPPIIVTGRLISGDRDAIVAPVVISGEELARRATSQIGAVLANLPGVSTSGFAPGASRPVLRGFDGPRVQVLTDGLGSLDASSVSGDHGVAIDTLNVDRIDVLHGPEVLLYAADPAGGAINAVDRRIPRKVPAQAVSLNALAAFGSAADALNLGGAAEVALGDRIAVHVDASYNHSNDLRVGGLVLSPQLRAATLAQANVRDVGGTGDEIGASLLTAQANARGRLPNSGANGYSLGAGIAFIDTGGSLGVSIQRLSSDYGIPPRPSAVPGDPVSIALRQTRYDVRGALNLDGFFEKLDVRAAYGDYQHAELDGGVPATQFFNAAIESRLELVQAKHGGWRGESGIQFSTRKLRIIGEPLLPNSTTDRFAAFTRQQLTLGAVDLEGSARFERTAIQADNGLSRTFNQFAAGAGIAWHPIEALALTISATHGERAPSSEELFINGAHDATQAYERGNPNFGIERSNTLEIGARVHSGRFAGAVTAYATDFTGYISPLLTGAVIDGFPEFQFTQVPAKFRGIEAEGSVRAIEWANGSALTFETALDYVHARLSGIGPAPRIPPLRLRGGVTFDSDAYGANLEVIRNFRQDRITAYENPVAGFTLLNAGLTWRPSGKSGPLSLILSAENLLNVVGRLATSETRDFTPIAGRDVRITVSLKI